MKKLNIMRIKNLIIAIITLTVMFSSCTQDEALLAEMNEKQTQTVIPEGAEQVLEPMENVESFPLEQQAPEITFLDSESLQSNIVFDTPITFDVEHESALESRGGRLNCNTVINSTTQGRTNKVSSSLYRYFGLNVNLDGADDIFHFTLSNPTTVDLDVYNTSVNMAMVLFKGTANCSGSSCSYRVNELIAVTRSSSHQGDFLHDNELEAGTYILVVDSYRGATSAFNLQMNCSSIGSAAVSYGDNFDRYRNGDLSWQSSRWSKWNASHIDGQVQGGTNKYLYVWRNTSGSQPSAIYDLDTHSTDIYHVDFQLWVAGGRSANFSMIKRTSFNNLSNEFGPMVYFYANGRGEMYVGNRIFTFFYEQNKWINVRLDIHLDEYESWISIDDHDITFNPLWSNGTEYGSLNFDAISFYPSQSDTRFWIDNIRVENL